ncbi:MAG: hypothetical protein ABEH80_02605 [Halobaculum sp.]
MSHENTNHGSSRAASDEQCATTDSFAEYGVTDGADLIRDAARELGASETVTVDRALIDSVEHAFRTAFLRESGSQTLPDDVDAALDDAAARTHERLGDETHDLRTDVVPAFYRAFAGFHCAYRTATPPDEDAFETASGGG